MGRGLIGSPGRHPRDGVPPEPLYGSVRRFHLSALTETELLLIEAMTGEVPDEIVARLIHAEVIRRRDG